MLEFIRSHKNLFSVIFFVAGMAMVLSMVGDPQQMSQGASMSSSVVAKVDGEEITLQTLYRTVTDQRAQNQDNIEEQVAKSDDKVKTREFMDKLLKMQVSPDRVLAEMIQQKFAERVSSRLGLEVSSDAVVSMIHELPYFQKDGKFDPIRYKSMVAQPGIYEREIRKNAMVDSLRRSFIGSMSVVSPEEQKIEVTLKKRYNFEVLNISANALKEPVTVTAAEVDTFMNDSAQNSKLQAYFDRNLTKYNTAEEVHARHILIDAASGGEAKAKEVLAEIKAGKVTFDEAAKKFSTDKSNAATGGDLGFFGRGAMKPEFESAAFGLKKDQDLTDAPVKTEFGYHLIQRLAYRSASSRKLDEVKKEIAEAVLTETRKSERAHAFALTVAAGKAPNETDLKRLGLTWSPVAWTPLESSLGPISNIDNHRAKLLTLSANAPYYPEVIRQGENSMVVIRLAEKQDPKAAPTADETSPSRLAQDKAISALSYFMQEERARLEKAKKIVRNEAALAQIKTALGDKDEGFGGMPFGAP